MFSTPTGDTGAARDLRVRDQVRGVLALVAFTALASGAASVALLLVATVGR